MEKHVPQKTLSHQAGNGVDLGSFSLLWFQTCHSWTEALEDPKLPRTCITSPHLQHESEKQPDFCLQFFKFILFKLVMQFFPKLSQKYELFCNGQLTLL